MKDIYYRAGYCVSRPYSCQTRIRPGRDIVAPFIHLSHNGLLELMPGFYFDGASGFPDTPHVMRGAAIHDAKYRLIRLGFLGREWKAVADDELAEDCKTDGMLHGIAEVIEAAVLKYGDSSTRPGGGAPEYIAPGNEEEE